jgi:predicted MFS family arabinose efflux permease
MEKSVYDKYRASFVRSEEMDKKNLSFLIGGLLAMAIALGIGRFSYTPILPLMQQKFDFPETIAGYLASANYAGYLIGAILTGLFSMKGRTIPILRISLIIGVATTCLMSFTTSYTPWALLRFLSGVCSAIVFVLASSIVLSKLREIGRTNWSGFFYMGPGCGIFLTGISIPFFYHSWGWKGAWIGLAGLSLLLLIVIFLTFKEHPVFLHSKKGDEAHESTAPPRKWLPFLIVANGCEGLGYIVTGTFIVSIAQKTPSFHFDPSVIWTVVGITAIPSCLLWSACSKRWGFIKSLILAMFIQAVGVSIPVWSSSSFSLFASAAIFGATFMGITSLGATLLGQMVPKNNSRIMGYFTAAYAVGQMIGPTLAGVLSEATNNYNTSLLGAAAIVLIGSMLLMSGLKYENKKVLTTKSHRLFKS